MRQWILLFTLASLLACSTRPKHYDISEPISKAIIDGKISSQKASEIITEYIAIQYKNDSLGNAYAKYLEALINLGADSIKIDNARTEYLSNPQVVRILNLKQ